MPPGNHKLAKTNSLLHRCSSQLSAQTIQGLDALDGPSFLDEGFTLPELEALMQDPVGEAPSCTQRMMQDGTSHLAACLVSSRWLKPDSAAQARPCLIPDSCLSHSHQSRTQAWSTRACSLRAARQGEPPVPATLPLPVKGCRDHHHREPKPQAARTALRLRPSCLWTRAAHVRSPLRQP